MSITTGVSKTRKVVISYVRMVFYGCIILAAAIITAYLLNSFYPVTKNCVRICDYIGYLGWAATLGSCGWDLETLTGNSTSVRLNENLAKIFSIIGIFAFVLGRELIPVI